MDGTNIDYRADDRNDGYGVDDYNQFFRAGLSWLAYARKLGSFVIGLLGVSFLELVTVTKPEHWIVKWALGVTLIAGVYLFIKVRKTSIFTDEDGVWMASGVFPWQKAVYGVKWSDIGTAATHTGFASWASGSYPVVISHRWTQATVLDLHDVRRGRRVVERINEQVIHLRGGY